MDKQSDYNFYKLTPIKVDKSTSSYKVIEKALNQAYKDSDIKNIAITGIYGSGKSSVLRTYYEEKFKKKETINVSIADFDEINAKYENICRGQKDEDKANLAEDDDINKSSDYISFKNNISKSNRIKSAEKQIINQILYQISPRKIPLSRFKIKYKRKPWEIVIYSICLILAILGLFMLINKDFVYNYFYELLSFIFKYQLELNVVKFIINSIILLSLVIPLIVGSVWIVKRTSIKFTKFNFKGAESELMENDYTNILDQETRELVYLIRSADIDTIIFEDLDRFNDISIFIRLREINSLINFKSDDVVRFVYVIRDDLFESKDRVKFFDLVIPVIPSITSKNSRGKILKIFGDLEPNIAIDKNVLLGLSIYIDDMRLLYSIRNEYEVYSKSIDVDKNANELFGLIVLKNIFPKEFDDLERDRGYIYEILNKRESLNEQYYQELNNKIKEKVELENSLVSRLDELIAINIPNNINILHEESESLGSLIYQWSLDKEKKHRVSIYNVNQNMDFNQFYDYLIKNDDSLKHRVEQIQHKDVNIRIDSLSNEIKELNKKISLRNSSQMKELLNELSEDKLSEFFEEDNENYKYIRTNHYYELIRYLLLSGLLDENYWSYKGYFYNSDISKNDHIFISRVLSGKKISNDFKLDNPCSIMGYLNKDDYYRKDIINYNLIDTLIGKSKDIELLNIFKVIVNNEDSEAIEYFNDYNYSTLKKFTLLLKNINFNEFWSVIMNQIIPYDLRLKIAGLICVEDDIQPNNEFIDYIENSSEILELDFLIEKSKIIETLNKSNIMFLDTSKIKIEKSIATSLLEIVGFKLVLENIINLISIKANVKSEVALINFFEYVYDESESLNQLREEINSQINDIVEQYVRKIKEKNLKSSSGETAFLELLNSKLKDTNKLELIDIEETVLSDISNVESEKILIYLAEEKLIQYSKCNVINFYKRTKKVLPIIDIINSNYKSEFEMPQEMYVKILNSPETDMSVFKNIMSRSNITIENISEGLEKDKYIMLINKNSLEYNLVNFNIIVDTNDGDLLVSYINSIMSKDVEKIQLIEFMRNNSIIDKLPYQLLCHILKSNVLDYESSILLLDYKGENVSLFDIKQADINIRKYILNNYFSVDDCDGIINEPKEFDLFDNFIKILNVDSNIWNNILQKKLTIEFVDDLINHTNFNTESKLKLLSKIIEGMKFVSKWEEWISSIEDIKEIANVFEGKKPNINSDNIIVVNALEKSGVISKGKDDKIHLIPTKYKELLGASKN